MKKKTYRYALSSSLEKKTTAEPWWGKSLSTSLPCGSLVIQNLPWFTLNFIYFVMIGTNNSSIILVSFDLNFLHYLPRSISLLVASSISINLSTENTTTTKATLCSHSLFSSTIVGINDNSLLISTFFLLIHTSESVKSYTLKLSIQIQFFLFLFFSLSFFYLFSNVTVTAGIVNFIIRAAKKKRQNLASKSCFQQAIKESSKPTVNHEDIRVIA